MRSFVRIASALLFVLIALPFSAHAATMSVSVPSSVNAGDIVTARVLINSGGISINNAEATLSFPSGVLQVLSVSKTSSLFSLWISDPTFSNSDGTVSFNGGVPNPGFTGTAGTAITVTFQAKTAGTATLALNSASVRANDGLGTEVLYGANGATVTVTSPVTAPASPPTTPTHTTSDNSITLSSPSHPNPSAWYNDPNPLILLGLPGGAGEDETIISSSPDTPPSVLYRTPINQKQVTELADGVWYFIARARVGGVWGPATSFALHIDTSAPTISGLSLSYDSSRGGLLLNANIADIGSGINSASVSVDGGEAEPVAFDALSTGYFFPYKTGGTHTLVFSASDKAGNTATSKSAFTVPESRTFGNWIKDIFNNPIDALIFLIALCSIASLLVTGYLWIRVKKHIRHPDESIVEIAQESRRTLVLFGRDLQRRIRSIEQARAKENISEKDADRLDLMREQLEKLENELVKRLKKMDLG